MKKVLSIVAIALVLCFVVGGTLAWLKAETTPVVNTFTVGDINIDLDETTGNNYKMVPGNTLSKDPKVTVKGGSEACWLFVKIEKSANYDTYLEDYAVASGWTALTGVDGVYYREVSASAADQEFYVLAGKDGYTNGYVTVKDSVTKAEMEALKVDGAQLPTLTFTAYAVQKDNVASAAAAWAIANPS